MTKRLNPYQVLPGIMPAMRALQDLSAQSSLDPKLRELVGLRASQLNGCAFCLDLHSKRAQALGESTERLLLLPAWRESQLYSAKEKAALAWTEALTGLAGHHVSDETYREVAAQFTPLEHAELTVAVVAINGWNRLNAPFQVEPGALGKIA